MATLNSYTDKTKKVIHLLVTALCDRDCKYCCNKQYDMDSIPFVTDEELKEAEVLFLTGGDPFKYSNPCRIASDYKLAYPNIKRVYVYTNALEFYEYLLQGRRIYAIDGVNVSIKNNKDFVSFSHLKDYQDVKNLAGNRLYVFNNLTPVSAGNFDIVDREWQEDFKPADDSIFRRMRGIVKWVTVF